MAPSGHEENATPPAQSRKRNHAEITQEDSSKAPEPSKSLKKQQSNVQSMNKRSCRRRDRMADYNNYRGLRAFHIDCSPPSASIQESDRAVHLGAEEDEKVAPKPMPAPINLSSTPDGIGINRLAYGYPGRASEGKQEFRRIIDELLRDRNKFRVALEREREEKKELVRIHTSENQHLQKKLDALQERYDKDMAEMKQKDKETNKELKAKKKNKTATEKSK